MPEPMPPLYRRVLGSRFDELPPEIRALHDLQGVTTASGVCEIRRGGNPLARCLAAILRMPPAATAVPVRVTFTPDRGRELWQRDFAGCGFRSTQEAPAGRAGHLIERFGALAFLLEVPTCPAGLDLVLRRAWCLGLPLPRVFWPRIAACERVVGGSFTFDVEIRLPLLGLMIHYRGRLERDSGPAPA